MSDFAVAYLSQRKLHIRREGVVRQIESEFAKSVRERAASIERRHAWKSQGRGAMFMGGAYAPSPQSQDVPVLLTGLSSRSTDGALLYSMETDAISGLFLLDAEGLETRLFHTADFRIRHPAVSPAGTEIAATAFHSGNVSSNIAILPVHGSDFSEVTDGDSFDQAPRWVPGPGRRIVFQSAGIGRNAAGTFAGLGPCAIQQLDLDSGELRELAAEDDRDLIQPRRTEDGTLYYIRKPYETGVPKVTLVGSIKDVILFPFRLGRAVFQYLNVFSMMYGGKPLVSGKGAAQRRLDPRQMFVYGNLAIAQRGQEGDDPQSWVPGSWELVRVAKGSAPKVLAKGVLAFDLARDGSVLYSNGGSISRIGLDGRVEKLVEGELIDQVLAL